MFKSVFCTTSRSWKSVSSKTAVDPSSRFCEFETLFQHRSRAKHWFKNLKILQTSQICWKSVPENTAFFKKSRISWIGHLDSRTAIYYFKCKQTRFFWKGQISCKKEFDHLFVFLSWAAPITWFFLKFKFAVQLILWLIDKEG